MPLNPLLYAGMQDRHEVEMRALRAWYIRKYDIPVQSSDLSDREALEKSLTLVFPSMLNFIIKPHILL